MNEATELNDAHWLEFGGDKLAEGEPQHVFAGPSRQACPGCDLSLTRYAELDLSDSRLGSVAKSGGRLALAFCWRCGVSQEPFHYVWPEDGFEARRFGVGPVETDFPYAGYPDAFEAAPLRLTPVPADELEVLRAVQRGAVDPTDVWRIHPDLVDPRHHVASKPLFVLTDLTPTCSCCAQSMSFLAGFGDRNLDPRGFVSEAAVQMLFHICLSCREVAAQQTCD